MQQKIVMKVQFSCQKRRTDALKIAAGTTGMHDQPNIIYFVEIVETNPSTGVYI